MMNNNLISSSFTLAWIICALSFIIVSCKGQTITDLVDDGHNSGGLVSDGIEGGIQVIYQDSRGNHWFGGSEKGIYRFDGEKLWLHTEISAVCGTGILGIQEDGFGNIFFDTTEGVCKFNGESTMKIEADTVPNDKNKWSLEKNDLWFRTGWDKSGPFRYNGQSITYLQFEHTIQAEIHHSKFPNTTYSPYGIYSMYRDKHENMWFGTASVGFCRFDGEVLSWIYEDSLSHTPEGGDFGFRSIIEDQKGNFWMNNTRYLYKISPNSFEKQGTRFIEYSKEKGVGYINEKGETEYPYFLSMTEDQDGNLWMVTYDDGVYCSDGTSLTHYPVTSNGSVVLLFSIYRDREDKLWLGTHKNGVFVFNGNEFQIFNP